MKDEEDPKDGKATWIHDAELSFKAVIGQLELAKGGVEDAISAYKADLGRRLSAIEKFKKG